MPIRNFGSICSGIEAASFTLTPMGINPLWLSEIAEYPNRFLAQKYPEYPNLGDMSNIPDLIKNSQIPAPDLLVGGTPCQAFSLAGWRNGVNDERGQLTLKYIDIINAIDAKRKERGEGQALFFWENVEGALTDKTNAFGCFLAGLAGIEEPIEVSRFKSAGVLHGTLRNIAWRVLDAKYFGVPQQRKRVYVLGGGTDFYPENILFEIGDKFQDPYKLNDSQHNHTMNLFGIQEHQISQENIRELCREINGHEIEVFRCYSDCLYAAYGTKWNGNAAAFNGSLFISQNGRLRRLTPIECERLMGFPDNYTSIANPRLTNRYQATGNSWAVPVIKWIMNRLISEVNEGNKLLKVKLPHPYTTTKKYNLYLFDDFTYIDGQYLNASPSCYNYILTNMLDIVDTNPDEKLYISKAGCAGILRRKREHNSRMNPRLEKVLENCSV
ncbi:DNA cytosine methyltransferase [uncultured Muribaculum sp.]|uniref:DNA cytosine methyltransferase n=1 Tax=uncultured Muribaculum sp. TaxID=1918613 RepID=UPI002594497B|nr:DNA cytosine methyltransferase [uncultured Muribaculum sp.]